MVSGETSKPEPITTPPPPPAKVITAEAIDVGKSSDDKQNTEEKIRKHQEMINEETNIFIQNLATATLKSVTTSSAKKIDEITPEQREMGKSGEEEIKRRLERPGGWEGFGLIADKRELKCGYDFLCAMNRREVKLEVKTFTQDGRIFVTSHELQEAATSQNDYYLIGVLFDEKTKHHEWSTFIIRNPIDILLTKGEFVIQTEIVASASDIFNINENH